ncbi:MAG TPA: Flp family type IVb pilin [Casimicrobiaceae bacterium]|jgi:pilus assembly protein Flp/PilA|nr:Flp family type IVb pilin [Casimicrobiaceae bacterium]
MKRLHQLAISFCADESGVTAIEYALIGALIAVVIAGAVVTVGSSLNTLFTSVANCFPSGAC